jgi:beta-N-acetylhexosaminidase
MTLEEKAGQLVTVRYPGTFVNLDNDSLGKLESLIRNRKIGGLILAAGEVYETAYLLNRLQGASKVPLLVAADLESAAGTKITGATLFPPLMAIGAAGSEDMAYDMGRITAIEGRAVGIHMNYAPVVDVNVNPDNPIINTRSFGEDPGTVGRLTQAFIRGSQENGMITTAKHFPGHGDTAQDSHLLLPTVTGDRARLDKVELYPFKAAIEGGVQAIMTAHLVVPALDPTPNMPATLSPAIMTGLLRKELGFKGLIVTDALDMGGVTNAFSDEEMSLKALLAGVDILLMPRDPDLTVRTVIEAVRSGTVPMARIDESVRRILEAKARLGLHRNRFVDVDAISRAVGSKPSLGRAYQAFEAAVTLVKNEGGALPLAPGKKTAVFSLSSDLGDYFAGQAFVTEMKKRSPELMAFFADGDTGQEALDDAAARATEADVVVFALFSSLRSRKGSVDLDPKHVALVKKLAAGPAPVTVVSFGSPYFLRHFPEVGAYLCLYRNTPQTQGIAARVLYGELETRGKLPVTLPGLFPAGHGLEMKK